MKKLVFSMLAMAALVSCTSESDPIEEMKGDGPDKVEIKMKAAVGITSKAPVTSNTAGILDKALTGIQFLKAEDIAANPDWNAIDKVASTADITADNLATGKISLAQKLYYNANETLKSWLIGYFPACTDATYPSSTHKGTLQWTIDGSQDILFANEVKGSKADGDQISDITFKHKLLQLQFKFKADDDQAITTWGKVTNIAVKTKKSGNLSDLNTILTCTLPSTFTWSDPGELLVLKATETPSTSYDDSPISTSDPITLTKNSTLGGYIMVESLTTVNDYFLVITTENATNVEVPITLGGAPAEGSAYEVELTFKAKEITPTAKITEWNIVPGGNGTVE